MPLKGNVLKTLAKIVLIQTVSASVTDQAIHKTQVWIRDASFGLRNAKNVNNFEWRNEWFYKNS